MKKTDIHLYALVERYENGHPLVTLVLLQSMPCIRIILFSLELNLAHT